MFKKLALCLFAIAWLVACGGNKQDGTNAASPSNPASNGITVDTLPQATNPIAVASAPAIDIAKLTSDPGSGYAGVAYASPIKVKVTDAKGDAMANKSVIWTVSDDGWTLPAISETDTNGIASTFWFPGSDAFPELTATPGGTPSGGKAQPKVTFKGAMKPWLKRLDHIAITYYEKLPSVSSMSRDVIPLTDPKGTFYAVLGWDNGYTGLQRGGFYFDGQIQFSLWDNNGVSASIVNAGNSICESFGNEGTGISCAYNYPWKTGNTYRFEVTAITTAENIIDVTAHFIDVRNGIRIFLGTLRQAGKPAFKSVYSFVEDVIRDEKDCMTISERRAIFGNTQYLADSKWVAGNKKGVVTPYDPTVYCATRSYEIRDTGVELGLGGKIRANTMSKSIPVSY